MQGPRPNDAVSDALAPGARVQLGPPAGFIGSSHDQAKVGVMASDVSESPDQQIAALFGMDAAEI